MTAPLIVFRSDGWLGVSGVATWLLTNAPADDPIVESSCALVRDGAELHQLVAAFTARSDLSYALVGMVGDVTQVVVRGPVRAEIATTRETQVFAGAPDGGDWSGYVVTDPIVGVTLGSASATSTPLGVTGRPGEQGSVHPVAHLPAVTPPAVTPPAVTPPAVTPPAVTPPAVTPVASTPMRWVHEPPAIAEPPPHQPDPPVAPVEPPVDETPAAYPLPARLDLPSSEHPNPDPSPEEAPYHRAARYEAGQSEAGQSEAPRYLNDGALAPDSFEPSDQSGPWRESEIPAESAHSAEPLDVELVNADLVDADLVDADLVDAEVVDAELADAEPVDIAPSTSWSSQPTSVMPLVSAPSPSNAGSNGLQPTAGDERAPELSPEPAPSEASSAPPSRGAAGLISDVSWADDLASSPTQSMPSSSAPARALDDMSWTSEQPRPAPPAPVPLTPSGPVNTTPQVVYPPPPPPPLPAAPAPVYAPTPQQPAFPPPSAASAVAPLSVPPAPPTAVPDYGSVPVASEPPQRPWFAPEEPFGNTTTRQQDLDITIWRPIAESSVMTGGGLTVAAVLCVDGHLNPLIANSCRVCAKSVPPQNSVIVPRPPLGTLNMSTSDTIRLDHGVIFGRDPGTPDANRRDQPYFVMLTDKDISRRHLEVILDGWDVLVVDLNSSNGSAITMPGGVPEVIPGGARRQLLPGTIVHLSDTISFVYEVTP